MRCGQCCMLCGSEATYRCVQCASWAHYCATCFCRVHSKANIFHVGEMWEGRALYSVCFDKSWSWYIHVSLLQLVMQDGVYKPVQQKELVVDVRPPHSCEANSPLLHRCKWQVLLLASELHTFIFFHEKVLNIASCLPVVLVSHCPLLWYVLICGHPLLNTHIWPLRLIFWTGLRHYFWNVKWLLNYTEWYVFSCV